MGIGLFLNGIPNIPTVFEIRQAVFLFHLRVVATLKPCQNVRRDLKVRKSLGGGKPKIWHVVHGQQSELLHLSQQQPRHMDHGYYQVLSGKVAVDRGQLPKHPCRRGSL